MLNTSIYLGRFFGLYLLIMGLLLIVRGQTLRAVFHDFYKNPALVALWGAINLILGLLFVLSHNIWEWNWKVVVTILANLVLFKGLVLLYLPEWARHMAHEYFDNIQTIKIYGFILAIIGIFLIVCTFFANNPPIFT